MLKRFKRTKNQFNRVLSLFLAVTMVIGLCPISVFASESTSNINLSLSDVNENQNIFSQSYLFNGELKHIYAYNTEDGTCRVTGDIPYSGGTFGNVTVRNEKGYIEFPFALKDLEVVSLADENDTDGCALLFLTKDNELRNFTYTADAWESYEKNGWSLKNEDAYDAPILYENVIKLEKNFFLDEEGILRVYGGDYIYKIDSNLKDFVFLGNNTIRLYYKTGDISFTSVDNYWSRVIDNAPNPLDHLNQSDTQIIASHYLSHKYNGNVLVVTPSKNYLTIDSLVAIVGDESFGLSLENANSQEGNVYTYNLFNNDVILKITMLPSEQENYPDTIIDFEVSTSDDSKPTLDCYGIRTNFGDILFKYDVRSNSYHYVSLVKDLNNTLRGDTYTYLYQLHSNGRSQDIFLTHKFFIQNDELDYDYTGNTQFKIKSSVYKNAFSFEDTIIDVFIDYENKVATLENRNLKYKIDISDEFNFETTNNLGDIIFDYFNINNSYYYLSTRAFPSLLYNEDENVIYFNTSGSNYCGGFKFTMEGYYHLSNESLEDLKSKSEEEYYWRVYNLYRFLQSQSSLEVGEMFVTEDILYLLKDYCGIELTAEDLFIDDNVKKATLNDIAEDIASVYLLDYLMRNGYYNEYYESWTEEDAIELKEVYLSCWDEENNYQRSNDLASIIYHIPSRTFVDFGLDYYLSSGATFKMDEVSYTYINEQWDDETYEYVKVPYTVEYLPFEGYKMGATYLILEEQAPYYTTISPYEYSHFFVNDNSLKDKSYYVLDEDKNFYEISFNKEINCTEGLSSLEKTLDFEAAEMSQTKIAENVVKVLSTGHYLTSNGNLYTKDGVLVKSNVTNIADNLYQTNSKWYYLDTDAEFKFDYATERNLRPIVLDSNEQSITYQFLFNEDIVYVKTPNGDLINNGDTYTINENGCYIFEVANSYGDVFEELIIVNHLGVAGLVGIIPMIVDGILTLEYQQGGNVEYSFDDNEWFTYTKSVDITGKDEIYLRGESNNVSLGKYYLTIDENSKFTIFNISPAGLNPDNFYGIGYVKNGSLYDNNNNILISDVTDVSILDENFSQVVYIDDGGELCLYKEYNDSVSIMPVFRSDKIDFESDISNPVDIYTDGFYTYILGDSGNLASVQMGEIEFEEYIDTYNYRYYYNWYESWITNDVIDLKHGNAYFADGTTMSLNQYGMTDEELLRLVNEKKFLDKYDNEIDKNDIIISAIEIVDGKIFVLTSNLDVYWGYEIDENDECLYYCYTIDLEAQNIDFAIENTLWLNDTLDIETSLPNGYKIFNIDLSKNEGTKYILNSTQQSFLGVEYSEVFDKDIYFGNEAELYIRTGDEPIEISYVKRMGNRSNYYSDYKEIYNITNDNYSYQKGTLSIAADNGSIYTGDENEGYIDWGSSTISGLVKNTFKLDANSSYRIPLSNEKYIVDKNNNIFLVNGTYVDIENYIDVSQYVEVTSNFREEMDITMSDKYNFTFTPNSNGTYSVKLKDIKGRTISKGSVKLGNIDLYEPELVEIVYSNGCLTPIYKDYVDETGRTSSSGVWTLEYSIDNGNTWTPFEGGLTYSPTTTYGLRNRTTVVTSPNVLLRATDKAGNVSSEYELNLNMEIYENYLYENGKTTVTFYLNDDNDWSNSDIEYSYDLGLGSTDGHSFSTMTDSQVTLNATDYSNIEMSTQKDVFVEVVNVEKTITTLNGNTVKVEVGNYTNSDFYKLYVNVDRNGYQEYDVEEFEQILGVGTHIIESYYKVEKDGQIVASQENLEVVNVPTGELNSTEIHTNIEYENGKTTLDFYANDDTNNQEFEYSYIVNGVEQDGHIVEVTENTIVELVAKKDGYEDGRKTINVVVVSTEAPSISDLTNNKNVTIEKGDIENATLEKIVVTIDGVTYEVDSASKVFDLFDEGTHNIKAYQVVKTIVDGEIVSVTSDEIEKNVSVIGTIVLHPTIEYTNGKTTISFYADNDINHDLGYVYTYTIDGEVKTGYTFELTTDKEVVIKAEKTDKISTESTLDLKVIEVQKPIITQNGSNAIVIAGAISNTTFDKLYVQYNNGEFGEFNTFTTEVPLNVGENIVKAYISTKTTINGQTVTIVSDTIEKTFNIGDSFNVVVKDHFGSNINTRLEQVFIEGATYTFSALNVEGWNVVGTSTYSGTVLNDLVIDFYYEEVVEELPTYYTLTVKDTFGVDTNIRFTQQLEANSSYVVNALVVNGWECSNVSNYSGTITNDIVIEFNYVKSTNPQTYYTLTVKDTFGSETNVRFVQTLVENSSYVVNALNVDGWLINGVSNYSGTITENLVIEFVYTKETQPIPTYYTLTVKDTFGSDTNVRFTYSFVEGSNYSVNSMVVDGWNVVGNSSYSGTMTEDLTIEFVYEKETTPVVEYCTLTVKDKFGETTNVRYTQELTKGSTYSVSALDVGGWKVKGNSTYSDTIVSDITIEFEYESTSIEPTYYNLIVKDTFGSKTNIRFTQSILKDTTYSIDAMDIEGWLVSGKSTYSGTMTSDLVIEFVYEKEQPPVVNYYTLTVKDTFGNKTTTRFTQTLEENASYTVNALEIEGWNVKGASLYTGSIKKDLVITFTYEKEVTPETKYYTLTVVDHFGDDVNTRTIQSLVEGASYNLSSLKVDGWVAKGKLNYTGKIKDNLTIDFYYEKMQESDDITYYNLIVKDKFGEDVDVRLETTLTSGDTYSFEALSVDGWVAIGETKYEGTITKDLVIVFEYEKETVVPDPDPIPPVQDDDPIEPPKTGDTTNSTIVIILLILSLLGILLAILLPLLLKKKDDEEEEQKDDNETLDEDLKDESQSDEE